MGNDIFYNHLEGFADIKIDTSTSPHKLLGRLAGGEYFEIGTDGEDGVNQYLYIAYADDEYGTNFSTTTPSNFISLLQSTEPITDLTADMFTVWSKFKGVDGHSTYVHIGYAMSAYGTNFSFTADKQHPFVAFITSDKDQSEITADDFAGVTFVRYHDAGWNSVSMEDLTDTNVSAVEEGNILQYDGTVWGLRNLSTVAYTGAYADLEGNPPYTSFDTTYLSTEVSEDGESQTVSINVDALQELVNSSIQTDLGYNTTPIESEANYFLNKNKEWVEVSGGGGGGSSYTFSYPLQDDGSGNVTLMMDSDDGSVATVGWVNTQGFLTAVSQNDVWNALSIQQEGSSSLVLAQNGTWVDLGGGGGTTYSFESPLSVDEYNNVSIDTSGFLTAFTKSDVDNVLGVSTTGSATKFYNQQGNFVEVSSGTSYTFTFPLKETSGTVTFDDTGFVKDGDLDDYALKAEIPTVPTKVSELTNDRGYITGITEDMVETALGISASGSASNFLNEQGEFVEVGGGSSSSGLTKWGEWESRSTSTEYTATTNGWLCVSNMSPGSVSVTVDGVIVFQVSHQDDSGMSFVKVGTLIPIFEGQVYYIEGDTMYPTFAPCV